MNIRFGYPETAGLSMVPASFKQEGKKKRYVSYVRMGFVRRKGFQFLARYPLWHP